MATKTFYYLNTNAVTPNFYGNLQDGGSAPATVLSTRLSWTPAAVTAPCFFRARCGATANATVHATTSFIDAGTPNYIGPQIGTGTTNTTAGDCFVSPTSYLGYFNSGTWTFSFNYQSNGGGNLSISIKARVWACRTANGIDLGNSTSGPRELTALNGTLTLESGATGAMTGSATNFPITITWTAPTIALYNEYLFFQFECHDKVAGVSGQTAQLVVGSGSNITTPNWNPVADPLSGRQWVQSAYWNGGSATSLAPAFANAVTSGNAVMVFFGGTQPGPRPTVTVTDNATPANLYTVVTTIWTGDSVDGGDFYAGMAYCLNVKNGPTTITITTSVAFGGVGWASIDEISGITGTLDGYVIGDRVTIGTNPGSWPAGANNITTGNALGFGAATTGYEVGGKFATTQDGDLIYCQGMSVSGYNVVPGDTILMWPGSINHNAGYGGSFLGIQTTHSSDTAATAGMGYSNDEFMLGAMAFSQASTAIPYDPYISQQLASILAQ
jgi:hypothetical protein